jgi:ketosteroid isomerase-like protein
MSDDIDLLCRLTEAFNRRDLDTLRQFYAPDLTAHAGVLSLRTGAAGRAEVLAEFASLFATFQRMEVIAEEYIERGGAVVVPSRWCGTVSDSEKLIEQRVVAVYRVREGRVTAIDYYGTLDTAFAAVDAEPRPAAPPHS